MIFISYFQNCLHFFPQMSQVFIPLIHIMVIIYHRNFFRFRVSSSRRNLTFNQKSLTKTRLIGITILLHIIVFIIFLEFKDTRANNCLRQFWSKWIWQCRSSTHIFCLDSDGSTTRPTPPGRVIGRFFWKPVCYDVFN